ncbi:DgyrCDS10134 [Dimorphilus gyrociliatus]|uniref:Coiled-coil domain-containing protein 86 n=1 Tax=Dimorphilus gyrociliatus TaxID=2664684 RepID=A0A7I8VZB6_9ANNE|nr:DgyrCDS10134 [Dimorphilus gyrociliatus]
MKTEIKNPSMLLKQNNLVISDEAGDVQQPVGVVKDTKGRIKSGRTWKTLREERHSAIKKVKPLKTSWEKKMDSKKTHKFFKEREQELKEERAQRMKEKRERGELNRKRREENQRKSEVVQVIKNTAKIKRMKKKQLRTIEKRAS